MHYYNFNIGDYKAHTEHLDLMEDLAFRRMLDWCYLHEKPLPSQVSEIERLIRMRTHSESIKYVLQSFFTKTSDGYVNNRIQHEVEKYQEKSKKAKESAKARWNKKPNKNNDKINANALQTESEGNAKHKTLNTKHKTINNVKDNATLDFSILGFSVDQIEDLKRIRKANKGTKLTQRIVNALAKEFHNATNKGYSFDELLTEWEVRGWKSFKNEWIKPNPNMQTLMSDATRQTLEAGNRTPPPMIGIDYEQ